MKKLKKQFLAAVLTAVMAVCAFAGTTPVAAATLSAKQYINKMAKATEKLKSYEMKMNKTKTVMTMTIPSNGKDTKIKVISYTKQKGNKLLQYTSTDNKTYEKSTLDLSDYSDMLSSVQTTDMYSDLKIVKNSVTVNGKSTVQIQAQLKGEDIAGLLAQLGLNGDNTQGTSSDYSSLSPITISLWIDKKTYYPVKQTIDMKDFMNEYLSSLVADSDMSYSKIKTSVTYKNFNKATKFSLPKACK